MMEFHPYAELFPLLDGDDFEKLKADIAENGLQQPVLLSSDGRIADGRNRYRACYELGIDPDYITHRGDDASLLKRVISLNLHRRHLTAGQRAMLALEIKPIFEAQALENKRVGAEKARQHKDGLIPDNCPESTEETEPVEASDEAGKTVGVSGKSVSRAETIAKTSPALKQAVQSGDVSLNQAYQAVKDPDTMTELEQSIQDQVWSKGKSVGQMLNEIQKKKKEEAKQASDYTYQVSPKVKDCKNEVVTMEQSAEVIKVAIESGQIEQSHAGWFETRLLNLIDKLQYLADELGEISNGNA